ncbi:hypothetical protein [Streptomyces sp. NPDC050560]|uniref:hypothetical protein n=1 Tax=Streptomyces sp. NPDC050560 TaxID=3365630 RepID=UPI00379C7777
MASTPSAPHTPEPSPPPDTAGPAASCALGALRRASAREPSVAEVVLIGSRAHDGMAGPRRATRLLREVTG